MDVVHLRDLGGPCLRGAEIEPAAEILQRGAQPAAKYIRERGIFHRYNHLPATPPDGGKHFHEVERAIVVDVLNGIVEKQRLPAAPLTRQMYREQKSEARRSSLSAAEQELRVAATLHAEIK